MHIVKLFFVVISLSFIYGLYIAKSKRGQEIIEKGAPGQGVEKLLNIISIIFDDKILVVILITFFIWYS